MSNGKKVLIVDDDPFILDMYKLKFKEEGFEVESASDGEKAFAAVKDTRPDVVLLDVIMPILDGFEVLKKLKADSDVKNIPVIMLTNLGQKEDMEKGMSGGAVDYIVKAHFTPSEVVEKVKQFLKI